MAEITYDYGLHISQEDKIGNKIDLRNNSRRVKNKFAF